MSTYIDTSRTLPEIFAEIAKIEGNDEKAAHLKQFKSRSLAFLVNGSYNVDWSGLAKPDTYIPSNKPVGMCHSSINGSLQRIISAHQISAKNPDRARLIITRVLEDVSEPEAKLLWDMFHGRKIEGLSKAVLRRVYPDFFRFQEKDETT